MLEMLRKDAIALTESEVTSGVHSLALELRVRPRMGGIRCVFNIRQA